MRLSENPPYTDSPLIYSDAFCAAGSFRVFGKPESVREALAESAVSSQVNTAFIELNSR